jgi:hypothetical protein
MFVPSLFVVKELYLFLAIVMSRDWRFRMPVAKQLLCACVQNREGYTIFTQESLHAVTSLLPPYRYKARISVTIKHYSYNFETLT